MMKLSIVSSQSGLFSKIQSERKGFAATSTHILTE